VDSSIYAIFRRLIVNSEPEYTNIPRRENDKKKDLTMGAAKRMPNKMVGRTL
jgi:hypothetical protein